MFKKKEEKNQIVIEKKNQDTNAQAIIDRLNDPAFKKAMLSATSDSDNDSNDPTKFTLLENLHRREKADFYTFYKDKKEVEQVNRIQTWYRLFSMVFGNSETVKKCQAIVEEHTKDNMVNRASLKRARESALVYAVKQDTGLIQADKQISTFLRGRN